MHCTYTNVQRLRFKKPMNWRSTITRATVGHTVSMGFFYDPTCTNKIFHRFQPADVSGTVSMALLSEGQQTHPAATKTRKHMIYGFSDLPENKKIKQLQERFAQIQRADTQAMEITKRKTLFDNVGSFPAASVGISPLHSLKMTTATVPSQRSDVSRATATAFLFAGKSLQTVSAIGKICMCKHSCLISCRTPLSRPCLSDKNVLLHTCHDY